MIVLVAAFFVFLQAAPGLGEPILPLPRPPAAQPAAPGGSTQTTTTGGNTTVVFRSATQEEIEADSRIATRSGMNEGATIAATDMIGLTRGGLAMGDWMLTRDPNKILDYEPVKKMNEALRWAGIVIWIICIGLVLLKHALGPFAGAEHTGIYLALPLTLTAGMAGFFNAQLLRLVANAVHALLGVIVNAALKDAIEPALHLDVGTVANTGFGILAAPVVALLVAVVGLLLIVKMWAQVGWLFILSAVAPIYVTKTGAPLLGRYGAHWWRAWFGTLLDPILLLAGLRIAAAGLGFLDGTLPKFWDQIFTLILLLPLLAAPGWHAGAYGGNGVDWLAGMAMYRATGLFRHGPTTSAAPALPAPVPTIWPSPVALSGHGGGGTGGGVAASWWKTARWSPAGWSPT
jgi:hypothetical protein